eukprot:gnl/TRDRNA2_/TRDRNA2_62985_c0_seq1.p1 gnl/TRDRNA2_/TRDRNA2_62985_c0~~gnl/TRDRNA2_/TRDRNA2_62985_c0_seq1.p1  ORF type:complete len:115 (-),score=29.75 gnl/TRDRNA2_/TRDRNA2_62985_c0_seq1:72-416(-)
MPSSMALFQNAARRVSKAKVVTSAMKGSINSNQGADFATSALFQASSVRRSSMPHFAGVKEEQHAPKAPSWDKEEIARKLREEISQNLRQMRQEESDTRLSREISRFRDGKVQH